MAQRHAIGASRVVPIALRAIASILLVRGQDELGLGGQSIKW